MPGRAEATGLTSTRPFAALGHRFAVAAEHPELVAYLDELWAPFAEPIGSRPVATYLVRQGSTGTELLLDGETIARGTPAQAVAHLLWSINAEVVARTSSHVTVHAGAVERDGRAVVLPAAMESGKTTLTAALVRSGFDYLSDEVAAFELGSDRVVPYPKPLSVDEGSWQVLADLRPDVPEHVAGWLPQQWQLRAERIRPGAIGGGAPVRHVVTPRYEPGARTHLTTLHPSRTVQLLAEHCFGMPRWGEDAFDVFVRVARGASAHELVVGDLDVAVELIAELVHG